MIYKYDKKGLRLNLGFLRQDLDRLPIGRHYMGSKIRSLLFIITLSLTLIVTMCKLNLHAHGNL